MLLKRAARAASGAALLGASEAHRNLPRTGFAAPLLVFIANSQRTALASGQHPAGAISAATRSTAPGSVRASALRDLTCRICSSAARSA
jgi:hypothetical protein